MATKKAVSKTKKTTTKKAVTKKAVTPSGKKKTEVKKGSKYVCDVCGLVVSVDNVCGCVESCDIICCGEPMKAKKIKK